MFEIARKIINRHKLAKQEQLELLEEHTKELDLLEEHEREIVRLGCSLKDLGIKLGRQEKALRSIYDRLQALEGQAPATGEAAQ